MATVMGSPLIHVGYHKTATTWLQKHVFPKADLGFGMVDRQIVHKELFAPYPLEYDMQLCRVTLQRRVEEIQRLNCYPVISHEPLSGHPHSGGWNCKEMAERLAALFPSSRILIVIREQRSAILSSYRQYVKVGGTASLERYVFPPERWSAVIPLFRFDYFKYHYLIEHYQKLFGKDQVLVLPYELFSTNPNEFVAEIVKFAQVAVEGGALAKLPFHQRENTAPSTFAAAVKRRLNFLYPVQSRKRSKLHEIRKRFVDETSRLLGAACPRALGDALYRRQWEFVDAVAHGLYEESNARVAAVCRLDLAAYGYRLKNEANRRSGVVPVREEHAGQASDNVLLRTNV
jgi:hypothetical protein